MIWMIFALGYNLLLGYGGLPSFGHGAFFGVGAYAFGLAQLKLGAGLWGALAAGVLGAALAGALVASFVSHRRGIYYALLTDRVRPGVLVRRGEVAQGDRRGGWAPQHQAAGARARLRELAAREQHGAALLHAGSARRGRAAALAPGALAVRPGARSGEAERGARRVLRYNTWLYKWSAFTISCAVAGLAGSLFALAQQSAYPNVMSLHNSGFVVMMVLVGGGLVSFWGPLIGAAFFLLARDLLGAYTETWLLWYGLVFMAVVLFKPEGIAGMWRSGMQRFRPVPAR
jgi:branched-chain amino acid transport system permease protein